MRTPWREAIDGKARVLRDLRNETTYAAMEQYFLESASLRRLVGQSRREAAVTQMAVQYADVTRQGVHRAEPFWVWDAIAKDIVDHIASGMAEDRPFKVTDLPVPEGLLWFQQPIQITQAPEGRNSAWVRAIFFGEADIASIGKDRRIRFERTKDSMAIVAFLDSAKSGFLRKLDMRDFLMPWICNPITEGQTMQEYRRRVIENSPQLDPLDFGMSSWPTQFCLEFFRLLQQKLLLYGGSGLEREARREAKRYGFEPSVRVVEWRKAEYRYPEGHIPAKVNWSCQWVVKPHLRRYKSGKVVQVRAYTKGPKDKPLKAVDNRVHVVKR